MLPDLMPRKRHALWSVLAPSLKLTITTRKASEKSKLHDILGDVKVVKNRKTEDLTQNRGLNRYTQHRILEEQDDICGDLGGM